MKTKDVFIVARLRQFATGHRYVADKTEHKLIYLEIKWNFVLTWIME